MNLRKPILSFTNNTQIIESADLTFEILGYVGGILMGICLIPQIIKTCREKSAKELSYVWQFISIFGLVLILVYGIHYGLLALFLPILFELLLMISLIVLKCYFDRIQNRK